LREGQEGALNTVDNTAAAFAAAAGGGRGSSSSRPVYDAGWFQQQWEAVQKRGHKPVNASWTVEAAYKDILEEDTAGGQEAVERALLKAKWLCIASGRPQGKVKMYFFKQDATTAYYVLVELVVQRLQGRVRAEVQMRCESTIVLNSYKRALKNAFNGIFK